MIIKAPVGIKIAFGENPKATYNDKSQSPSTRMATAALIRETFKKAQEYQRQVEQYQNNSDEEDPPEYDIKSESLLPLLNGDIPLHAHVHRADDIFTAVRIAREFNLNLILVHCTEGHLLAEQLADDGYPVLLGPDVYKRQ